jgi:hypothetical protein
MKLSKRFELLEITSKECNIYLLHILCSAVSVCASTCALKDVTR